MRNDVVGEVFFVDDKENIEAVKREIALKSKLSLACKYRMQLREADGVSG